MSELLCELMLPQHGVLDFNREQAELTAMKAFGPLSCPSRIGMRRPDTFDFAHNRWLNRFGEPTDVKKSARHTHALEARCRMVNDAREALSSLQTRIRSLPNRFLSAPTPPMPERRAGDDDWRRDYGSWLEAANARSAALAIGDNDVGRSPRERRFRCAADLVATLPRPAEAFLTLFASPEPAHYSIFLTVPQAFGHPGNAFTVRDGQIVIDLTTSLSPVDHASLLTLSHFSALVVALRRYETDPRTTLDVEIFVGSPDERKRVGRIRTAQGAWSDLETLAVETPLTELHELPELDFDVSDIHWENE